MLHPKVQETALALRVYHRAESQQSNEKEPHDSTTRMRRGLRFSLRTRELATWKDAAVLYALLVKLYASFLEDRRHGDGVEL